MRADYLRPWMDLLLARVEPGERILAQGRAFEPHRDDFELTQLISGPGCAVVVTERRALWVSRGDRRWVRTVPFAVVRSYVELTQAHRYALAWTTRASSGCGGCRRIGSFSGRGATPRRLGR